MKFFKEKFERNPAHAMVIQTLLNLKVSLKTLTSRVRNLYSWLSTNPALGELLNPCSDRVDKSKVHEKEKKWALADPASKKLMRHLAE